MGRGYGFWTAARDEQLRKLWAQMPPLTGKQLAKAFGFEVSHGSISARAGLLGLPGRIAKVAKAAPPEPVPDPKNERCKSPFAGQSPVIAARKPEPRAKRKWERHQPCPYWVIRDGRACPCGVMVNRGREPIGDEAAPQRYCPTHEPLVRPHGRDALGWVVTHHRMPAGLYEVRKRR